MLKVLDFYDFSLILFILFHKQVQKSLCQALIKVVFSTEIFIINSSPNITGSFYGVNDKTTGAFTKEGNTDIISDGARWGGKTKVTCDASLCNTSYASVDTIQPCSGYVLMIIKA